jgi:hypothetical protein
MKQLILFFAILFSSFCFAQHSGSIIGLVLDEEVNNEPLMYANVSINGTTLETSADTNGFFQFNNLADGNYILAFSFNGYEAKELSVKVSSNHSTNVSASLMARTLTLSDLVSLHKENDQQDKASSLLVD